MIPPPITPGLIDVTYTLLEESLKPYKVYLGTEYLSEQHAAPKIVIAPEQDALSKARARDVSVNLAEKTEQIGVTPLAQRALGLSVYCYGRGPGYTETEALWQAVVSELERSDIAWNPESAVVRYSTDIPHAQTNRVAVFSFETSAVTFDAPQLVVIEKIISDCLEEPTTFTLEADALAGFETVQAREPVTATRPSFDVFRLFITEGEGRWFDGVAIAEWTFDTATPYEVLSSSASTEFYEADLAFDANPNTAWRAANYQQAAQFLQIELTNAISPDAYSLTVTSSTNARRPSAWRLEALSANGLWLVLDEQSGVTWGTNTQTFEIGES